MSSSFRCAISVAAPLGNAVQPAERPSLFSMKPFCRWEPQRHCTHTKTYPELSGDGGGGGGAAKVSGDALFYALAVALKGLKVGRIDTVLHDLDAPNLRLSPGGVDCEEGEESNHQFFHLAVLDDQ